MAPPNDYVKAYDSAKRELDDLLAKQREIERRIIVLRQSLQTLATLAESEGVQIEPSTVAAYFLENSTLADEIRSLLKSAWPGYLRPNWIKNNLATLGHDLSKYQNPQASIHMVLKRMVESGEVTEATIPDGPDAGKQTYRIVGPENWNKQADATNSLAHIVERRKQAEEERRRKDAAGRPGPPRRGGTGIVSRDDVKKGLDIMKSRQKE
jgi:hypothetical protein